MAQQQVACADLPRKDRARTDEAVRLPSIMEVPRWTKITLNMGVVEIRLRQRSWIHAVGDRPRSPAKPVVTISKKATPVSRSAKTCHQLPWSPAWRHHVREFLTVSSPCRAAAASVTFRGISGRSFDGRGNYKCYVKEQIIFRKSNTKDRCCPWSEHQHHDDRQDRRRNQALLTASVPRFKNWGRHGKSLSETTRRKARKSWSPNYAKEAAELQGHHR